MKVQPNNQQLKQFVDNVFTKHSSNDQKYLTALQLYDFFKAVLKNPITYVQVQQTLKVVRTNAPDKITKREMYQIIKTLLKRKRELGQIKSNINILNRKQIIIQQNKDKVQRPKSDNKVIKQIRISPPPKIVLPKSIDNKKDVVLSPHYKRI